jgi:hypothetical protein
VTNFHPRPVPRALVPAPAAALLVILLMAAYAAGYAWSAPNTDSADELMRAYEIRHAIAFPLEGPPLGNVLHLGPFWFYLTALPLFASHSWLAAALFIGLVCGLKFPLAYWCGRRLVDADFGLLWAIALFLPGWPTIEQLVFLNPNGVAAAMLAALAIALPGLERPASAMRCGALGLALALALHVHPTSLPVFILAPMMLWVRHRHVGNLAAPTAAMAAGFALPFVSYVASQAAAGIPDWASAGGYVAKQVFLGNVVNAPTVIGAYLLTGPATMVRFLLGWPEGWATAAGAFVAALAMSSLAAAFAGPLARARLLQFLAALVLTSAWIACARPTTPVQFSWALAVPVGAVIALGLWSLARASGALRAAVVVLVAAALLANLVIVRALALMVREGEGRLPSLIMDIKGGLSPTVYRDVWFPAHAHAALGDAICAGGPASLHGHLAYVIDKDLGLDTLFACGERSRFTLAASDGAKHHAGMTRPFWRAISARPDCWIGSLGLVPAAPLLPRGPIAIADGSTYLPRRAAKGAPQRAILEATAPAGAPVLLTNVLGGYEHFEVLAASANGGAVAPAAVNDLSSLYAAPAGTAPVSWRFEARTTRLEAIDVIALRPSASGRCLAP